MPSTEKRTSPETLAYRRIWALTALVLAVCFVGQMIISADPENFVCAGLAWLGSMVVSIGILRPENMRTRPVSTWVALTYTATSLAIPLFAKTLEFEPLTFNLTLPTTTFTYGALGSLAVALGHYIYGKATFLNRFRQTVTIRILQPLGLFRPPAPIQLFFIGFVGALSMVYVFFIAKEVGATGDVSQSGDLTTGVVGKIIQAMADFAFAPVAIPLAFLYLRNPNVTRRQISGLLFYLAAVFILALLRGGRGVYAVPIATVGVGYIVGGFSGRLPKGFFKPRIVLSCLVGTIILIPVLNRLAIAIVLARHYRGSVSPIELLQISIDKYQDTQAIDDYLNSTAPGEGAWNETYVHNTLLGRFVETKFHDLGFAFSRNLSEGDHQRMIDFAIARDVTFIPGPILKLTGIDVDKTEATSSSFGDYLFYLNTGGGLHRFRVVSMLPIDRIIFGNWSLVVLVVGAMPVFLLLDCLTMPTVYRPRPTPKDPNPAPIREIIFSPLIVITLYSSIVVPMQPPTITQVLSYSCRGYPQLVLLYALLFWLTGFANRKGRTKMAKVKYTYKD